MFQICPKNFLLIKRYKTTVPWTYLIDLNGEKIIGTFYGIKLKKKKIINELGSKKYLKEKVINYMSNGKVTIDFFNSWIVKEDIVI